MEDKFCVECKMVTIHINNRCLKCGWTDDIRLWQKEVKEDS